MCTQMHKHTHMHVHVHTHKHARTHARTHTHTHTHTHCITFDNLCYTSILIKRVLLFQQKVVFSQCSFREVKKKEKAYRDKYCDVM